METLCLENQWRKLLTKKHWSEQCTAVHSNFIATSSLKQYNSYINQFQEFCVIQNINFPPDEDNRSSAIAEFLLFKAKQSERPGSMLQSVRAALTHFFNSMEVSEPFCIFLKQLSTALIKSETARPKGRTPIMPLKPFTDMFERWPDNDNLTLAKLRVKAVTLITIGTLARCSDLAPANVLKRKNVTFNKDGSLTILFHGIKNDSDRKGFEIRVECAQNPKSDPVKTLRDYINRTADKVDQSEGPIFIKPSSPFGPVTPRGIADILRTAIKEAGLSDTFTPRSFRPSATSAAVASGCDHETVRQLGRWKTREVFYESYVYPLPKKDTTDKILNSDLKLY